MRRTIRRTRRPRRRPRPSGLAAGVGWVGWARARVDWAGGGDWAAGAGSPDPGASGDVPVTGPREVPPLAAAMTMARPASDGVDVRRLLVSGGSSLGAFWSKTSGRGRLP